MKTTWGDRVRAEREARGWTQHELARRANCGRTTITRIEDGYKAITLATAKSIADCFALPPALLFPYEEIEDEQALAS